MRTPPDRRNLFYKLKDNWGIATSLETIPDISRTDHLKQAVLVPVVYSFIYCYSERYNNYKKKVCLLFIYWDLYSIIIFKHRMADYRISNKFYILYPLGISCPLDILCILWIIGNISCSSGSLKENIFQTCSG